MFKKLWLVVLLFLSQTIYADWEEISSNNVIDTYKLKDHEFVNVDIVS